MRNRTILITALTAAACLSAGCSDLSMRRMVPRFLDGPSDERPPWRRDPPAQQERLPAPEGWGGDNLASAAPPRRAAGARPSLAM